MRRNRLGGLMALGFAFALALVLVAQQASAITAGQIDDFEDGTTMGWANGVPGYLVNVNSGGPGGASDHFLQLTADSVGAGGRLTTFNLQQWLGDYISQGITAISIDLRNQGATTLSIRLAFKSQNTPNTPGYLSAAMVLPVGSGWQHFSIPITAGSLIAIGGPAPFNTFFSTGLGDARIINEVGASNLNGDFITGQVGIDNIRAVPEPSAAALLAVSTLALAARVLSRRSIK